MLRSLLGSQQAARERAQERGLAAPFAATEQDAGAPGDLRPLNRRSDRGQGALKSTCRRHASEGKRSSTRFSSSTSRGEASITWRLHGHAEATYLNL